MDGQEETGKAPFKMEMLDSIKERVTGESIDRLVAFALHHAKQLGYNDNRLKEIEEAFTEVLTNITTYAFGSMEGEIELAYTLDRADRVKFRVIDWGTPFNMLLASDPLFRDEFAEKGLPQPSTKLIKRFTDTVEYQRVENMNYLFATFSARPKGK